MLRQRRKKNYKAQVFLEYVIVVGVVVLVMFAMNMMIKRGAQGMIKVVADQIGNQAESDQQFNTGYLESSYTAVRSRSSKNKSEFVGTTTYTYNDATVSNSDALIDMGFTQEN